MALSSRLKLWEKKIQEENHPVVASIPPPPPSGGFLKQLVRDSEKETKQKEPDVKDEKPPSKLSDNLVQQFLLPDQTPPILEAEMLLRAEKQGQGAGPALPPRLPSSQRSAVLPGQTRWEVTPEPFTGGRPESLREEERVEKMEETLEERQEPEGRLADATVMECDMVKVKDVWYEAGAVWYVHKDGFTLATQMKPDEGTPELPQGRARLRLHSDGSLLDVDEDHIDTCNPVHLDLCEDLSELHSVNESSVLHTLISRAKANMPLTHAGPNLINFWPPLQTHNKAPKSRRGESCWEAPPALAALVKRVYVSAVDSRRDHCVCATGRSGTGKTATCQAFAIALLKQAGTAGPNMSVERVQAMFTVLKSFGCVASAHSDASSRFAMLFSLDFNHAGRAAAGQLQTIMLDKWHVCHMTEGESNFLVFSQMLAGLGTEMRSELRLHQLPERHSFGIVPPTKVEEKQRASVAFAKLLVAMETLGFSAGEQKAIWHVLAGIYHLGAAGACKVGRRQFLNFDSAQVASSVLGCEGEELHTFVFKHHLRQLLQRATGGAREHDSVARAEEGPRLTAAQCVDGMASGLYQQLFAAIVSLINRSLSGQQLALASVTVVDTPGLRNPRHAAHRRAANFSDLAHNYLQERLAQQRYAHAFTNAARTYAQENIAVDLECPEANPADVVSAIDRPPPQVRAAGDSPRGLLWALDEEMLLTPASDEGAALARVCRHYGTSVRQCEQALHCEVQHLTGKDAVRYDLSGWFGVLQHNPAAANAAELLRDSHVAPVKSLFASDAGWSRSGGVCGGVCGLEGWSQRSLQRSSTIRKTLSGGAAALRRHSPCVAVKLQADALLNVMRRAKPVFLQCVSAKTDAAGAFHVAELRTQLKAAQTLATLRAYRAGQRHARTRTPTLFTSCHQRVLCRLPGSHDAERLPLPLPGLGSAHHEALRLHVCQPRREEGRGRAAGRLGPGSQERRGRRQSGADEARRAAPAGGPAGPAGDGLAGPPSGGLRRPPGQTQVPHAPGAAHGGALPAEEPASAARRVAVELVEALLPTAPPAGRQHGQREAARQRSTHTQTNVTCTCACSLLKCEKSNFQAAQKGPWSVRIVAAHFYANPIDAWRRPLLSASRIALLHFQVRVRARVCVFVCLQDEILGLRKHLEKSEKERKDLRQTLDACETKLTAVTSELSDERFRGDALGQALDVERAERLRLGKDNKELQVRLDQCKVAMETLEKTVAEEGEKICTLESQKVAGTESELVLQLECCQTEVDFLRRRLQQTEDKVEAERRARQQADDKVASLQAQLDESKRAVTELKRRNRRVANELHDARVMTDNLHNRAHQLERKQRRFDGELAAALADADGEREMKDKTLQEQAALGVQIFTLRRDLQESRAEACRLLQQKDELCSQIRDLSVHLTADSLPELKKRVRHLEGVASEREEEVAKLSATVEQQQQVHVRAELEMARVKQMHQKELEDKEEELEDVHGSSQRRLRQLEMQLEQEYEEKQMVIHEKHDLEGLVATLCEQVGHRDFDVEKKLRRDLKRTHALLADAQTLLDAVQSGRSPDCGTKEQLERLHCQLEESESRRRELESVQTSLTRELEDVQIQLDSVSKQKTLADDELCILRREKVDLLKRLEEDQDDLNQLMSKHKALIAQSSGDIAQIRDLQAELEELKKQRHGLQEELQQQASRLRFLEASTVGRSIVSKQEARVCDLENKLEFSKGQVKRFEVLVLRLRDSAVRLGEELEQSAQSEARERDNARYFQQRLEDARVEMEELSRWQQDAGRRRMELELQVEELTAIRQTLQADLETSIRRIVDLQAALEEVRSSDDSDSDRESSAGSVGTEDAGEGGVPAWRGSRAGGSSCGGSRGGRRSAADSSSTYSFRSRTDPDEDDRSAGRPAADASPGPVRAASSSALSELLEGLRKRRAGGDADGPPGGGGGGVSLPVYQSTAASALRRRASARPLAEEAGPGILKPSSPLLPRSAPDACDAPTPLPSLPRLSSLASSDVAGRPPSPERRPEEDREQPGRPASTLGRPPQAPRRCALTTLLSEDASEGTPAPGGAVFRNRRLPGESDAASVASDVLPAIRRAQSAGSLAGSARGGGGGGRRALSVHFGELPPSTRRRGGSDTGSSGSGGSAGSGEPVRPRRRSDGPTGERLEAEGSEGGEGGQGDVAAVMRKYLNKEIN
ncbi:unconventional myosin-XVIIIb isoform X2 [Festucalex cinctus]